MAQVTLSSAKNGLQGTLVVPGDKSISHRALLLGSIAEGTTIIRGLLPSEDVDRTLMVLRNLGVDITTKQQEVIVQGKNGFHFNAPQHALQMGNSGTTTRLLMGFLSKQPFEMTLIGDESLSRRPMTRVHEPLAQMGAQMMSTNGHLPVHLQANQVLKAITYTLPVASAQVKSALILAGLQAEGTTIIHEPLPTRDHTERMLAMFDHPVERIEDAVHVTKGQLKGTTVDVPADISSAAFWIVAGLIVPNSQIRLLRVGTNPTRTGILQVLQRMGASIKQDVGATVPGGEPVADLTVATQPLQATTLTDEEVPSLVDEIPIIVLAATQAQGTTIIRGAEELRVKETDRIATVTSELTKLGARIQATADGFIVTGGTPLHAPQGTIVDAHGDHRIGMMLAVAAQITTGDVTLVNAESVAVSYPTFFDDLAIVRGEQ